MRRATLDAPPRFRFAERNGAALRLESDTGAVAHVFVLEPDVIRLVVLPDGVARQPRTWAVAPGLDDVPDEGRDRFALEGFSQPAFELSETPGGLVIATDRLRLRIELDGLRCAWSIRIGKGWSEVARDRPTQAYNFGWWGDRVSHYLLRGPDEQYFGLGEKSGALDRAGRRLRMSNTDAMGYDATTSDPLYKHLPFVITRRLADGVCYGLFYDTLSDCTFDLGCERSNYHGPYRYFEAPDGDLDLYVIAGPALADVVGRFTWLTGKPAATPDWALGYSASTMSYTDAPDAQARMAGFLEKLDEHALPCSSFHLSSGYTSIDDRRHVFTWNHGKFPDPQRFTRQYAEHGVKLIANVKPVLLTDHPRYPEAAEAGLLLKRPDGTPSVEQFWDGLGSCLDFTNPKTADWWAAQVREQLLDVGVAATWNDNNEYEITDPQALAHGFGAPFAAQEMKPLQTLLMLRASRRAQLAHAPSETPFLVTRAGFAGMQRYAQTWSGDNFTSWKTLRANIAMGLGLALSGVSNIGHDVGGFAGPAPDGELLLRWIGFGVFMPRFSIHSWNDDGTVTEPWSHPEHMDAVRALFALRERLRPVIAEALADYRDHYTPAIRPVFFDFPDDPAAWMEGVCFLLGSRVLVCPVVSPGVERLSLRLPKGATWRDGWTGAVHPGGAEIEVEAPLDRPPYFLRVSEADHQVRPLQGVA